MWADFSSEDDDPQGLDQLSDGGNEDEDEDEGPEACNRQLFMADSVSRWPSVATKARRMASSQSVGGRSRGTLKGDDVKSCLLAEEEGDMDGDCCSTTATETEQPFVGTWSVGGEFHDEGNCKPCIFVRKPVGCSKGEKCSYCHFYHERRPRHSKARRRQAKEEIGSAARTLDNFRIPTSLRESSAEGPWPAVISPAFSMKPAANIGAALSGALHPYQNFDWGVDTDALRTRSPSPETKWDISSTLQPYDCAAWGVDREIVRTPSPDTQWDKLR